MRGSISITGGSRAAFAFWLTAWRPAFGALALAGLLGAAAAVASLLRDFRLLPGLYAAYLLAVVMAQGALLRLAGAGASADGWALSPGWGGFQWGALEWRLLAVAALRLALFLLLGALLVTLVAVLYVGLATARSGHGVADAAAWRFGAGDPWVSGAISFVAAAGVCALVWVGLRLYLAPIATAAAGQVRLLSTWPWTRGRALTILGSVILVFSPLILAAVAIRAGRVMFAIHLDEHRAHAAALGLIVGFGRAFLALPASVGLMSYLHDRLGPADAGAP